MTAIGGKILKEEQCSRFISTISGIQYKECPIILHTHGNPDTIRDSLKSIRAGSSERLKGESNKARILAEWFHELTRNNAQRTDKIYTELEVRHSPDSTQTHCIVIIIETAQKDMPRVRAHVASLEVFDPNGKFREYTLRKEKSPNSALWITSNGHYSPASNDLVNYKIHETNLFNWFEILKAQLEKVYSEIFSLKQILPTKCKKGCINSISGYCRSWCLYYMWLRSRNNFYETSKIMNSMTQYDIGDVNKHITKSIKRQKISH